MQLYIFAMNVIYCEKMVNYRISNQNVDLHVEKITWMVLQNGMIHANGYTLCQTTALVNGTQYEDSLYQWNEIAKLIICF